MDPKALEASLLDTLRRRAEGRACVVCFSGGLDSTVVLAACLRAGLPEESWKTAGSVRLRRFTAETF